MRPKIQYKKMPEEKAKAIKKGNDIVSVRLNDEKRVLIEKAKKILCVDRDSTCLWELTELGFHDVLHDTKFGKIVPKIIDRVKRGLYDDLLLTQKKMEKCNTKEE